MKLTFISATDKAHKGTVYTILLFQKIIFCKKNSKEAGSSKNRKVLSLNSQKETVRNNDAVFRSEIILLKSIKLNFIKDYREIYRCGI